MGVRYMESVLLGAFADCVQPIASRALEIAIRMIARGMLIML